MEALGAVLSWLDLGWVAEQINGGNGVPLFVWSLAVAACCFAAGCLAGGWRAGYVPKWKIAQGFTDSTKKAAADALKADGVIPLNGLWEDVASFNALHPGIFTFGDKPEAVGSGTAYQLSPEWRRYLNRHKGYLE